ncbi:hypothetical protein BDV32DRAFT_155315 [Aspergillus pseudonomiae]|nr:hypothetical protein BDV32DRAFT_155315 [Aspergillus pseudonomiae]
MKSSIISTFIFAILYASTAGAIPPGTSNPDYSGGGGGGGGGGGSTGAGVGTGAGVPSTGGRRVSASGLRIEGSGNTQGKTRQEERYVEGICTTHGMCGTCQAMDANGNDWTAPCNAMNPCANIGSRLCNIDTLRLTAVCA